MSDRDHDAEVSVRDFDETSAGDRGPSGKQFVFQTPEKDGTIAPEVHDAARAARDEADNRLDADDYDSGAVVARITVTDAEAETEWVEDEQKMEG